MIWELILLSALIAAGLVCAIVVALIVVYLVLGPFFVSEEENRPGSGLTPRNKQ